MHYTKDQILELGIRPRKRKSAGLLPVERREVAAVSRHILKDPGELWQFWRLIPFEDGYACEQKHMFGDWVRDEVENMWYDIGEPVFGEDGSWCCPEGGWWPYLRTKFLDVSWLRVGNAIIDMDEVWTTLRTYLQEKIQGYRMCPGMMLYRVAKEYLVKKVDIERMKAKVGKGAESDKAMEELKELERRMANLVRLYPTRTTEAVEDRVWVSSIEPKELWMLRSEED